MMTLDRYLIKLFFPVFAVAASMFVLLLSLIDLFANLWRYLNYEVPAKDILSVSLYYLPKSFSYALPISLLFAVAYTLGDLYAKNELTSVFSSGIPFRRFSMPFLAIGIIASVFAFFFEDRIVIPTFKTKNEMSRLLLHQQRGGNNSDIVIKARGGQLIYSVDYFDERTMTLVGINIVEQDEKGDFLSMVRSPRASWNGEYWELQNALMYRWEASFLRAENLYSFEMYTDPPEAFLRSAVEVEELPARDAALLVEDLRKAGLPYVGALADYYHRYSFPFTSFVVIILSISMGGWFKKNILLMSLLTSLAAAVVYYVMEMVTMMMARTGHIPPIAGAWFPVIAFIIIGFLLLSKAKT